MTVENWLTCAQTEHIGQIDGVFLTLMINKIEARVSSEKGNRRRSDLSSVLILNWHKIACWELWTEEGIGLPVPRRSRSGKLTEYS